MIPSFISRLASARLSCIFFIMVLLFTSLNAMSQIGIGVNPPDSSAILHVQDTARGLLISRMTAAQRNAIQNPAEGLLVYQTDDFKGYWSFDGNGWGNISQGNKGANMIVLTDDITDLEAQIKIQEQSGPFTREIKIIGCTNLTTVDLTKVTELANIVVANNPVLQSIDLRNLISIQGGEYGLSISTSPSFINLNLSSLTKVITQYTSGASSGINIADTKITNLSLPKLKKVKQFNFTNNTLATSVSMPLLQTFDYCYIYNNAALTDFSFPNLNTGTILITNNNSLASVSLPALANTSKIDIEFNNSLTSVSFPSLTTAGTPGMLNYGSLTIKANPNLTSISLVPFTTANCQLYDFSFNNLSSGVVNNILHTFVSINPLITGKGINLSAQGSFGSPPTGQGIIDRTTLISNNNTVSTD